VIKETKASRVLRAFLDNPDLMDQSVSQDLVVLQDQWVRKARLVREDLKEEQVQQDQQVHPGLGDNKVHKVPWVLVVHLEKQALKVNQANQDSVDLLEGGVIRDLLDLWDQ
jgi:hypothetical protein